MFQVIKSEISCSSARQAKQVGFNSVSPGQDVLEGLLLYKNKLYGNVLVIGTGGLIDDTTVERNQS